MIKVTVLKPLSVFGTTKLRLVFNLQTKRIFFFIKSK